MNNTSNENNMYDYLVEKLEGTGAEIEVLDNGGILVSKWKAEGAYDNQLYIPPNIDSNKVSVISYLPGSGGFAYDAQPIRNKINSDTPPDCIITLAQGCDDKGNTMEAIASICSDNNLEITNLTVQSFSASGGVGFQKLETFLENHPNVNATMIVADGYNMDTHSIYFNNVDTLAEKQIPIILVNPHNNRLTYSTQFLGNEKGLNMYVIESDRGGHTDINADIINNGLLEYSLGIENEFGGTNNNLDKCNYIMYKYDPDNPDCDERGFVLLDNFEEIRQENLTFGYTLERLESNPFEDGTVASDMYQIVNSVNGIRGCVSSNTVQMPSCSSTSTIPGSFADAETSLIGISSDLNSTIYKETQVISSIAQTFYDMDRERTNAASQLSDGSEISFDDTAYYDVLNQLINVDVSGEMNFGQFLFSPGSHIEGNSGKLCASDINSMLAGGSLSGPLHENLENERVSARNTKQEIDNLNTMISIGTNFQGDIWKAVSGRLDEYSNLMDLRIESADVLEKALVEALTLIQEYMGDYEELDDSKLPELRERVEQIKKAIIDAQNIIDATHTATRTYEDARGGTSYYYVTEYVYSVSARRAAREYITQATGLLSEVEKEIVKLEGLPIILAQAEQIVNDALSEIYNKYGIKVSNVVCGKEVSYIPPSNTVYSTSELPKYTPWIYKKDIPEGKVDMGKFYSNTDLLAKYGGSYDDYLNGVERENNPMYNSSMEDKGIEPGQSLDDKIFQEDEPDVPEETTPEDEINTEEETEVPETDKPVEVPQQQKPTSPQNPSGPSTPSKPSEPEQPSEPTAPSQPSEPEQPSEPSTPSQPSEPEQPSEPSTPSQPSEPEQPSEPSTPSQPSEPEQPSEPTTSTKPSNPNDSAKPTIPSVPVIPEDSGEAGYPDTPIIPDEVYPEDGDLVIDNNIGNNDINQEIPPIVEIPDNNNNNNNGNDIVDITPPGNEDISNTDDKSSDLIKTIGIISGVGAAVGTAALGAHTISKAMKSDMYEDD